MLTKEEAAWLKKLQTLLDKCPSERLGFYTIGDSEVNVYDRSKDAEIDAYQEENDGFFCSAVDQADANLGALRFPTNVHATSG